jgi:DNA polymerase elongation subunit (family B)
LKILLLDIETAPKVALVWRFFKENISPKQVKQHGHIMSFAAKWLGGDDIYYEENRKEDDKAIVRKLCALLDQADIAVAHNGEQFDLKQIRARAVVHKLPPFSPVKIVDTYKICKQEFGFPSNSLEYLSDVLKLENKKTSHKKFPGFQLWLECLRKNEEAWQELKTYNIEDVLALEELYHVIKPWATNHPNVAVKDFEADTPVCPKCGSVHMQSRGFATTQSGVFRRYQCQSCHSWSRSRYRENSKNVNLLVPQRD